MELLKEGSLLPEFRLESTSGQMIAPQDYRAKKNLVLVFFDPDCTLCTGLLKRIADGYSSYQDRTAEVLAIAEAAIDRVREVAATMGLPFPALADPDGRARSRFADKAPAVVVADRFGEVRLATSEKHFLDQESILGQLDLIELECPECGVPTWAP